MFRLRLAIIALALPLLVARAATVLVEAEAFENFGGWVLDQQFMDQMGSPFLLAHGIGTPVADAATSVKFPEAGSYRVLVRTRDWVAPWKAPGAPGRFQVVVDGKTLEKEFGNEGAEWHWQDGGSVQIANKDAAIALHDLTGFEGRCDAILFTTDAKLAPPNAGEEMASFRRKLLGLPEQPEDGGAFDLVVVGGGTGGICAAIGAARLGLSVAFVQDRPVLGGNNSSEVRVWLNGEICRPPYPAVGALVKEIDQKRRAHYGPTNVAEIYEDEKKTALVRAEKNITLLLENRMNGAEMENGRIAAIHAQNTRTGRRLKIKGRWFADCTGDACLAALAKADFEMTPKGHMGICNLWNIAPTDAPVAFPKCPWALDLSSKPFPGRAKADPRELGGWYWESGFDHNPFEKMEYIRDWNFRAMYGAVDALKNVDGKFPNFKLNWSAYVMGPRESRRVLGDHILCKDDLMKSISYPDGCLPTSWNIDLHVPHPAYVKGFEGDAFISTANFTKYPTPYWVPYRCLYSRNVPNLFVAGRNVSVSHEALGTVRVMRTGGMMGEIVAMAAALCKKHNTDPRGVYAQHLDELKALMTSGVGKKTQQ